MIDDLIDLYLYIKNSQDLRDLSGWHYMVGKHTDHYISLCPECGTNPHDSPWSLRLSIGTIYNYRQLFLSKNKIHVGNYPQRADDITVPGMITEVEADFLMQYLSTDEIVVINQIYLEMRKLVNRSMML